MKKLTFSLILSLLFGLTQAQTNTLDGFLKSKWGSSRTEVKENNADKGYLYYDGEGSGENVLIVLEADFAGESDCLIIWKFTSDKLFEGTVLISPDLEARAMEQYEEMSSKISGKYGTGETYESYDYPYEKDDGHWETAFRLGKGNLDTYWNFDDGNIISMTLTENLSIKVTYQSSDLVKEAIREQEAAISDDL